MILIKDGRVIDPVRGIDDILDVILDQGVITAIGKYQRDEKYERIIEAAGLVVSPGLVDVHVHFRDPGFTYKEDIHTGAAAAAKGGFTTVVCMANTRPAVDNTDTLRYVIEEGKKTPINVLTIAAITRGMAGKELTDMDELAKNGAVGFSDDGIPLMDERLVVAAMQKALALDLPLSLHDEHPALIVESGVNQGAVSAALGVGGAPSAAEDVMVARDCMLALYTGARVNIQHVSTKNAVKLVRLAKEMGANIVAEVSPQHFSLSEQEVLEKGALAKVNPPLRTKEDRYEILEGLKDGTLDIIATDHAPHSAEEKNLPFAEAPSGMIGLETSLALGITELVRKGHLTLPQLIKRMSTNPSRLYKLNKGSIDTGAPADLTIFDPGESFVVKDFVSKSANSPFVGRTLYGRVRYTLCGGSVVYEAR
ncbi:MAG: dihydroorotase [Acetanaerobacterium sp.]